MMRRRTSAIIGLEVVAVGLALLQNVAGVQTDEAKYLLNIPYPHPPLVRWILSQTELLPYQDLLWRIVFATLVVQCVHLVWDLGRRLSDEARFTLCGMWLLSSAVLFQAGTVMMAPLTAVEGLVFLWLLERSDVAERNAGWVALLWLVSLFTAYQAVLYGPVVLAILWRTQMPRLHVLFAVGAPVVLAGLYAAVNPLIAQSFLNASTQNAHMTILQSLGAAGKTMLLGGSIVLSVLGVVAALRFRSWSIALSLLLVFVFVTLSLRAYYAILFVPLLVSALARTPELLRHSAFVLALHIIVGVAIFAHTPLQLQPSTARVALRAIGFQREQEGVVLIAGSFGHQWQYESSLPILHYRLPLLSTARAVVCLEACSEVEQYNWRRLKGVETEIWVRK